jgi:cytochrome c-type biogenesis protein CcmH/NrfF
MWALGLIVGALIGAIVAQGGGALVGAIVGVAAGIVVGQQRKGVNSRIETLESQMLNLESRINALGQLEQAKPPREYRRATLWGVLILGVVVLAWMAWQLSRQLNASSSSLKSEADATDRPA